jgi:hypothetical protein
VKVRPGHPAGSTDITNDLALLHLIPGLHEDLRLMQESAEDPPTVVNVGRVATNR